MNHFINNNVNIWGIGFMKNVLNESPLGKFHIKNNMQNLFSPIKKSNTHPIRLIGLKHTPKNSTAKLFCDNAISFLRSIQTSNHK